jgi:malate/lactate dehydrogenase
LSLPSIVGRDGVIDVIEPDMSDDERQALWRSAEAIGQAEMHWAT